ncbi:hypothetical protein QFZ94_000735 [Paraburkholderia sp. JPY465]
MLTSPVYRFRQPAIERVLAVTRLFWLGSPQPDSSRLQDIRR